MQMDRWRPKRAQRVHPVVPKPPDPLCRAVFSAKKITVREPPHQWEQLWAAGRPAICFMTCNRRLIWRGQSRHTHLTPSQETGREVGSKPPLHRATVQAQSRGKCLPCAPSPVCTVRGNKSSSSPLNACHVGHPLWSWLGLRVAPGGALPLHPFYRGASEGTKVQVGQWDV